MTTVLVTGATGNVGAHVVRELRGRGVAVRAFVRDADRAARLLGDEGPLAAGGGGAPAAGGVRLARGDFADRESVRRAVSGVDAVFLSSADGPDKVRHECAVIDAAASAGVAHLVKLSTLGAVVGSALPGFDWHGRIESHLRRSGLSFAVVQAGFFMTNVFAGLDPSGENLFAPAAEGVVSMIDPRDVAAAAAALLAPGAAGSGSPSAARAERDAAYPLTGPEPISYRDVAATLSTVLERPVTYVDSPPEMARRAWVEAGLPDWLVAHLTGAFALIREGGLAVCTDTVRTLTGRPPRPFVEFAREQARLLPRVG